MYIDRSIWREERETHLHKSAKKFHKNDYVQETLANIFLSHTLFGYSYTLKAH